ncbi:hypothetical protein AAFZ08_001201 [Campylobacter fetus]|nr:hypothetical protein [Campylobacter fetus]EEO2695729.1 hypothetical protein [Campylobacter fetus]EFU4395255.1 hypothetical protein [Campylobacter fetus]EGK8151962.1 hypothetical protein [Campylobacter fetus]EGK8152638.1 hypothetical protein [Campylobacter fetus]EKA8943486.1 hypothetical protein [Campylobacter fetus]
MPFSPPTALMFLPSNSPNIAPSILMENTGFTLFTSKTFSSSISRT